MFHCTKSILASLFISFISACVLISCDAILRTDTEAVSQELPSEKTDISEPTTESTIIEESIFETNSTLTEITVTEYENIDFETMCSYLKKHKSLQILKASSITLTADEYLTLCEINPATEVITKVEFEGTLIDLSSKEIDISNTPINDKECFGKLLEHFPDGIKLIMCDCGYTDEEMGALREVYPHISFVWRIYLGKWSIRTDDEAFSVMIYDDNYTRLTSEDLHVLKYCTNMYALDLGHQAITDLSVIGEMTDLRVLILADNKITDLTPLSNLKKLQYLELFVNRISDLSPLSECTELVDLNFGWNSVWDLSPIYSLENIERLWLPTNPVSADKHSEISCTFTNAQIVFEDVNSISSGWRTHERYFSMRGMFTNNKYDENFVK